MFEKICSVALLPTSFVAGAGFLGRAGMMLAFTAADANETGTLPASCLSRGPANLCASKEKTHVF